jgi:hypothetical protein
MNVILRIPDDVAERLGNENLGRRALEALALEELRAGRLTRSDLRALLGLATSSDLDTFLNAHGVRTDPPTSAPPGLDLPARMRAFRTGKTLGGLDPAALIREGRR